MEYEIHGPFSEECGVAINRVASYELHISDAYLSMRPNIDNWGNGLQALKFAVQLENTLTNVLQDLKITATKDDETGLIDFVKEFIDKQTASIAFLEYHQKLLEESLQQKGLSGKSAESAETSVEET
nr:ferritin, higher subunit-like [Pan troglodytes]